MVIDQGLYIFFIEPKEKPSYHACTSFFLSERWYSSKAAKTSSSVNPKQSAYGSEVVVITTKLFKSEKIDSLLILVIPVRILRSK